MHLPLAVFVCHLVLEQADALIRRFEESVAGVEIAVSVQKLVDGLQLVRQGLDLEILLLAGA